MEKSKKLRNGKIIGINLRRLTRKQIIITITLLFLVTIAAILVFHKRSDRIVGTDTSAISQTVANLPQRPGTHPVMRLASNLMPPTNKWFSSVAFSKEPQPIYAYPMTFKPTATGFEASYPNISGSSEAVFQIHRPDIVINLGATQYQVDAYDDLSVRLGYYDSSNKKIATVTVTHGSPYIFVQSEESLNITSEKSNDAEKIDKNYFTLKRGERTYGIVSNEDLTQKADRLDVSLLPKKVFTVFPLPANANKDLLKTAALNPITGTSLTYKQTDKGFQTTFDIKTTNNQPTVFASIPHQKITDAKVITGNYDSLYGPMKIQSGNIFSYNTNETTLPEKIDVSSISQDKKEDLIPQVKADIAATTLIKPDTYFAGKELYRAANLLELSDQLGLTEERDQLMGVMSQRMSKWLTVNKNPRDTAQYFYYDTTIKGVVGVEPAFGSDQFNDHHFHYGYFIYAAGVLGKYDPEFLTKNRDMIDVLVADIASTKQSQFFPRLRVFDPYVGHSWASGYGDFADGNNQESVSEAVNAWYGTYLWAKVTNNQELITESSWLYQTESQSALQYWFLKDGSPSKEYTQPFVSLIWGGKLDYATFFSPRPQAKLGILLIPMSPGQIYLKQSSSQIKNFLSSVQPSSEDFHGQFGDYLVMYEALVDPSSASKKAEQLLPTDIDDGNSRSYIKAWIYNNSR